MWKPNTIICLSNTTSQDQSQNEHNTPNCIFPPHIFEQIPLHRYKICLSSTQNWCVKRIQSIWKEEYNSHTHASKHYYIPLLIQSCKQMCKMDFSKLCFTSRPLKIKDAGKMKRIQNIVKHISLKCLHYVSVTVFWHTDTFAYVTLCARQRTGISLYLKVLSWRYCLANHQSLMWSCHVEKKKKTCEKLQFHLYI